MLRMRYTTVIIKTSFFNKIAGYFRKLYLCNKIQFFIPFHSLYISRTFVYRIIDIMKEIPVIICVMTLFYLALLQSSYQTFFFIHIMLISQFFGSFTF